MVQNQIRALHDARGIPLHEDAAQLELPAPNDYLPSSYDLAPKPAGALGSSDRVPARLDGIAKGTESGDQVYYLFCNKFGKPKAAVHFKFWNSTLRRDAHVSTLSSLFSELLIDIITERFYPAEVAGLSYFIHARGISALGFSDKLPELVKRLTHCVTKGHPDYFLSHPGCEARFSVLLERQIRRRKNFVKKRPMSIASTLVSWVVYEDDSSHEELLAELSMLLEIIHCILRGPCAAAPGHHCRPARGRKSAPRSSRRDACSCPTGRSNVGREQ